MKLSLPSKISEIFFFPVSLAGSSRAHKDLVFRSHDKCQVGLQRSWSSPKGLGILWKWLKKTQKVERIPHCKIKLWIAPAQYQGRNAFKTSKFSVSYELTPEMLKSNTQSSTKTNSTQMWLGWGLEAGL